MEKAIFNARLANARSLRTTMEPIPTAKISQPKGLIENTALVGAGKAIPCSANTTRHLDMTTKNMNPHKRYALPNTQEAVLTFISGRRLTIIQHPDAG